MFSRFMLLVVVVSLGACSAPQPTRTIASAPINLFNETLEGWERRGGAADFTVEDGCIVGRPRPHERNSFLCTTKSFGDFTLDFEFMIDDGFNSGVQIRSRVDGEGAKERVVGYQVEIDPSSRAWSAGIYEEGLRGWLAPLTSMPEAQTAFRHGAWNHVKVEAVGPRIRTWINGISAADLTDQASSTGIIALQVHGVGNATQPVSVRWRELQLVPRERTDSFRSGQAKP